MDVFQIMPNHMHAIISLQKAPVGIGRPTVGDIVGAYKSLVAKEFLKIYKSANKTMGKLWQRNYYENIIRNEKAYHNIANYIRNNPANWKNDSFHFPDT